MTAPTSAGRPRPSTRPPWPGPGKLRIYRNPLRLVLSASPWRAAAYLLSHLIVSGLLFGVALGVVLVAAVLGLTVVAIPLLIAAAGVIHGCAGVERLMLRQVRSGPVRRRAAGQARQPR